MKSSNSESNCRRAIALGALVIAAVVTCDGTPSAQETKPIPTAVCTHPSLEQSREMIRTTLDNVLQTYTQVGGGGISSIRLAATRTYVVSIAQAERIDEITYELDVDASCKVRILRREESSRSPGERAG